MKDTALSPYIARDGDTRAMLEFYHGVFGGELSIQTYGESPMEASDKWKNRVMHGAVTNGHLNIFASDAPENMRLSSTHSNISLSLTGPDEAALKAAFGKLSDGGKVTMPLEKQFWGDVFGMCDDKFGLHWMVNIDGSPAKK